MDLWACAARQARRLGGHDRTISEFSYVAFRREAAWMWCWSPGCRSGDWAGDGAFGFARCAATACTPLYRDPNPLLLTCAMQ